MTRTRTSIGRAALFFGAGLLAAQTLAQTISAIGTWGTSEAYGDASAAYAVSADGTVAVGWATAQSGARAVRWTPAGISDVGVMQGHPDTWATGVSWDGFTIVGNASVQPDYWNGQPFRWTFTSGIQPIGPPTPQSAFGVSADGSVMVGTLFNFPTLYLYRWTSGGGVQSLGILNGAQHSLANGISGDGTTIVGEAHLFNGGMKPIRWTQAGGIVELPPLDPTRASIAQAASYDGSTIVGIGYFPDNEYAQPVRWTGAGVEFLGLPANALGGRAFAVSADGSAIAGDVSQFVQVQNDAWIWTETRGFTYLNNYLPAEGVDLSNWSSLDYCAGISADGTALVGSGTYQGLRRGFVVRGLPPVCGPWITEPPQSAVGCSGSQVTLSVTAYGPTFGPPAFQWHKLIGGFWVPLSDGPLGGGTTVIGASSPSGVLTLANCSADALGYYTVEVTAGCGSRATSPVQVTLLTQPPTLTDDPVNTDVCPDGSASFSITPPAPANGPYTYQWEREVSPNVFAPLPGGYTTSWDGNSPGVAGIVTGANTATMTIAADTANNRMLTSVHGGPFRCIVSNACGSVFSQPAGLKVWSSCNSADMNGDHTVDFFDIDAFVLALLNPAAFAVQYPNVNPMNADVNHDSVVDFFDIDPFLACLFGVCP